jgi:hypothetical protein
VGAREGTGNARHGAALRCAAHGFDPAHVNLRTRSRIGFARKFAAGLYVAARQHEAGEPISIRAGFDLVRERGTNLSLFVLLLAPIAAAWVRLSALLFAVKFKPRRGIASAARLSGYHAERSGRELRRSTADNHRRDSPQATPRPGSFAFHPNRADPPRCRI